MLKLSKGEDYDAILALKNIDFGTVHLYTDSDKPGDGPAYGLQWLKDHNAASIAANKPMIVEEMGVNRTSPDLSVPDVLNEYQSYILSAPAIQGSLDWDSLNIDAAQCPLNNNPYALCTSDPFYT